MLNLKEALRADIVSGIEAATRAGALPKAIPETAVVVERSDNPEHGDYACPVALAIARSAKRSPMAVVETIAAHMPKKEYVGKLEAAAPGFLNIRINPGWMTARLDDVVEHDVCEDTSVGRGRRVNLEFISANPTGPLTLGNARVAFSVDTLSNVLTCAGYDVTREYYVNDAGVQIRRLGESVLRRMIERTDPSVTYGEELYQGDYIKEVAAQLAEEWRENEGRTMTLNDLDDAVTRAAVTQRAREVMLAGIKRTVADTLHIVIDAWTSEQALRDRGAVEQAVEQLRRKKATYSQGGTEYLKTTDFGDSEDRVLIKQDGEYAYIATDIAYHQDKFRRGFDLIFTFVGPDHVGHAPKLVAALTALGEDVGRLSIVTSGWVRIVREGKPVAVSKRRGLVVTPSDLIEEVGYDVARFFLVQHALASPMDFDLDVAQDHSERNPVYYVQYAYVRLQAILRKAKEEGAIEALGDAVPLRSDARLTHTAEVHLMRSLYRLPEVLTEVATTFAAHPLPYYALDVARSVHQFYRHVRVLAAEDAALRRSRLQLVLASRTVLGKVLDLLGIAKPDVM